MVLKDILIDKRRELLPYLASNVQGERTSPTEKLAYGKVKTEVGLGLNLDLNKNTSLELTINPDFPQVEADVTQIAANSSFSLQYPERRPFFNRGTDIVNFTDGAFYSRAVVNPSIASKLLRQGRKGGCFYSMPWTKTVFIWLEARTDPIQGKGGKVLSMFCGTNTYKVRQLDLEFMTNRFYNGGGYGHLLGLDGLFLLNQKLAV